MATSKPRLSVTFEPEIYELIKTLSELQGTSMSQTVNGYFENSKQYLVEVINAMDQAQAIQAPETMVERLKGVD